MNANIETTNGTCVTCLHCDKGMNSFPCCECLSFSEWDSARTCTTCIFGNMPLANAPCHDCVNHGKWAPIPNQANPVPVPARVKGIRETAEEHWQFIEGLFADGDPKYTMVRLDKVKYLYIEAMVHGWKHCKEEC